MSLIEKTKQSIEGLQLLVVDDLSVKSEIEKKVKEKIEKLELLDDDDEAIEAIRLFKIFLKDCYKHSLKLNKLEEKELLYENVLRGTRGTSMHQREFILKKLQEIDTDKNKFL
jgi:spore coat polysaccharide biosynthesis predicted glycosyltransferase SpsG